MTRRSAGRPGFVPDPGFERALLSSPGVAVMLEELVEPAARRAAELAPDDPRTTGDDLHTSVFGDVAMTVHGYRGRVGATDFKAPWFEEGAANVPARPFIRPAVEEFVGPISAAPAGDE